MRIAAISDTHLGFNALAARRDGRNVRELDVETAWFEAIEGICKADPDVVAMAGDIFHHPRVSTHALHAYLEGLAALLSRTSARIICAVGNHDAPRTREVLSPLMVAENLDIRRLTVVGQAETLTDNLSWGAPWVQTTVMPFEDRLKPQHYELPAKHPDATNLLIIHGRIDAPSLPHFYAKGGVPLKVLAPHFDVIVAGDYHAFQVLQRDEECLAFYCGATERTTTNPWKEPAGFGWVLCDTEERTIEHREVEVRPCGDWRLDKRQREGEGDWTLEALNEELDLMATQYYPGDHRRLYTRLVIEGLPRSDRSRIDWAAIKRLRRHMLHLHVDFRASEADSVRLGDRRTARKTLKEQAEEFLASDPAEVRDGVLRRINPDWAAAPKAEE